jgi:chromosome segregation ATPase
LKRLEREHESNLGRLRELNTMLDSLRSQEMHSKNEKNRMEDELEDLTRERNDLIRRMNELSDRYEDYVSTMNRERIEIMKANKNHVKLLTAKLLFQILTESIMKRRKEAMVEMKACSEHIQQMESKMQKFARIMYNYFVDRKRHYLR